MRSSKYLKWGLLVSTLLAGGGWAMVAIKPVAAESGLVSLSHLTTKDGWSNDLQSIVWNEEGQYYDLYFLHSISATNVFGDEGQNWYHTTTTDFKTYTSQNEAIASHGGDSQNGWKSAWTGSVIENNGQISGAPDGAKVAYFSGLRTSDGKQNIWAAYSTDGGKTYSQVLNDGKTILDVSNSTNGTDFRDPYIFTWNNQFYMYVAEGDVIGAYTSSDGISWTKADPDGESKIGNGTFFKGRTWDGNAPVECPVLKTMTLPDGGSKQVLFFGAKDASSGETTGTYYIVGHLDSNGLFAEETEVRRLDQGSDYYGANLSGTTDIGVENTSLTTVGWIGNWSYTANGVHSDQAATSDYVTRLGSYSTARTISLGEDLTISQSPILPQTKKSQTYTGLTKAKPLLNSNSTKSKLEDSYYPLYVISDAAVSQTIDLTLTSQNTAQGRLQIRFDQGKDYVIFTYNPVDGMYSVKSRSGELDNGKNGQVASSYYYDGLLGNGQGYSKSSGLAGANPLSLKVVTDKTAIEIFFSNGQSYTLARFSNSDKQSISIGAEKTDDSYSLDITSSNNVTNVN